MSESVMMYCMTKKQSFSVENPTVVRLANGRFAYRVMCPWKGKNNKDLYAFKFCSTEAYNAYNSKLVEDCKSPKTPPESPPSPEPAA